MDDTLTFPYLLQTHYSDKKIYNRGVPGYSLLQCMLSFEQDLQNGIKPELAIFNYAQFHNERNVLSRNWQESWCVNEQSDLNQAIAQTSFPGAVLEQDSLLIRYTKFQNFYTDFPLRSTSAIVNLLNTALDDRTYSPAEAELITQLIIRRISQTCTQHGISLLITTISYNDSNKSMMEWLNQQGVQSLDISVDEGDTRFNLMPLDPHPNAIAHRIFCNRIVTKLNQQ